MHSSILKYFSPLCNPVPHGARVMLYLQFPLWVVSNMCADFGSNFSIRSRVLKYIFNTFVYNSAHNGSRVTLCLRFPLWVKSNMCNDFGSNCSRRSRVLKYFSPFITPILRVLVLRNAYSFLCGL